MKKISVIKCKGVILTPVFCILDDPISL